MESSIIIPNTKKGRPPIPIELKADKPKKTKISKEPKPRGRPPKFNSEEEKKEARKEYYNQYYKDHAERICEHKKRLYTEKNHLFQQLLEQNKRLQEKEASNINPI